MAPTDLVHIPFHNDQIQALRQGQDVWCVVKRICENLGLADNKQAARLKRQPWAVTTMMVATGPDGKNYEMFCLHLKSLAMWLATIEVSRVKPAIRPKLAPYQMECADVLTALRKAAVRLSLPVPPRGGRWHKDVLDLLAPGGIEPARQIAQARVAIPPADTFRVLTPRERQAQSRAQTDAALARIRELAGRKN